MEAMRKTVWRWSAMMRMAELLDGGMISIVPTISPELLCVLMTTVTTRPKASGSSSRFQEGRGNRLRTRQGSGKDKTGRR